VLNKPNSELYKDVKDKILKKVSDGEWIFPLSIIHHFETMSRMDDRSRQELSEVMGEISCNYSIIPFMYVDKAEFFNSLQNARGLATVDFKDQVIYKDFVRSVGLDGSNIKINGITDPKKIQQVKETIAEVMENRNMFLEFMKLPPDRQFVTQLSNDNDVYIKEYEKLRAHYMQTPKEYRYPVFIYNNYMERYNIYLSEYLLETKKKVFPNDTFKDRKKLLDF